MSLQRQTHFRTSLKWPWNSWYLFVIWISLCLCCVRTTDSFKLMSLVSVFEAWCWFELSANDELLVLVLKNINEHFENALDFNGGKNHAGFLYCYGVDNLLGTTGYHIGWLYGPHIFACMLRDGFLGDLLPDRHQTITDTPPNWCWTMLQAA